MIKKVVLSFPVDATDRSLTYDLVKLYDIRINILKAEIQAGKSGNLLVELEADTDKLDQGIAYLIENGVTVSPVSSKVSYDASLCIDCGNCVSACFSHQTRRFFPNHFFPNPLTCCAPTILFHRITNLRQVLHLLFHHFLAVLNRQPGM